MEDSDSFGLQAGLGAGTTFRPGRRQSQTAHDQLVYLQPAHARPTDHKATYCYRADGKRADRHGAHCHRPQDSRGST